MTSAELGVARVGDVAVWTIAREARRNALTPGLLGALAAAVRAAPDEGVRAAVLTGAGDVAFSAGYDLAALEAEGHGAAERALGDAARALSEAPFPIVAALNGACVGGGLELALRCDVRVAHGGVALKMPPARLGIVYATEGLARLAAIAGESRARRMFLFAEPAPAEAALGWGLIDELVPAAGVLPRALARATEAAALAPLAVAGMRFAFEALLASRAALPPATAGELDARRAAAWAHRPIPKAP